jgi:hypothetical protein
MVKENENIENSYVASLDEDDEGTLDSSSLRDHGNKDKSFDVNV